MCIRDRPEEERNMNTLVEMINSMEVREDDESFKNAVDYMLTALPSAIPSTSLCANMPNTSWPAVLYALKDFLIKRLGSLLEHTT